MMTSATSMEKFLSGLPTGATSVAKKAGTRTMKKPRPYRPWSGLPITKTPFEIMLAPNTTAVTAVNLEPLARNSQAPNKAIETPVIRAAALWMRAIGWSRSATSLMCCEIDE